MPTALNPALRGILPVMLLLSCNEKAGNSGDGPRTGLETSTERPPGRTMGDQDAAGGSTLPVAPREPGEKAVEEEDAGAMDVGEDSGASAIVQDDAGAADASTLNSQASGCIDWKTMRLPDGRQKDCYPYRCVGGRCLKRCKTINHCAGSKGPADFAKHGWPLECIQGKCVPMPPEKVYGD